MDKYEYGFVIGSVSAAQTDGTITKSQFFENLESQYPSKDGWEVWNVSSVPLNGQIFVVSYHVRRKIK